MIKDSNNARGKYSGGSLMSSDTKFLSEQIEKISREYLMKYINIRAQYWYL